VSRNQSSLSGRETNDAGLKQIAAADGGFKPPTQVVGIDFSAAAADAGSNTWVAVARAEGGQARVTTLGSATDVFSCEPDRKATHTALVEFVDDCGGAAVGLDFPFAIPEAVMDPAVESWEGFVEGFGGRYPEVDAFTSTCVDRTRTVDPDRTYLKRATDGRVDSRSPYGFVVDTITYHGVRDILAAFVDNPGIRVLPVQGLGDQATLVLETYPAGHLDAVGLPRDKYKGGGDMERSRRREILNGLTSVGSLTIPTKLRERALQNTGGDGLDALAAANAAYEATRSVDGLRLSDHDAAAKLEAWVYTGRDFD
jgi:Protein of unknown function (DUF429).